MCLSVSFPLEPRGIVTEALSIILRLWIVSASWFILYHDVSSVSARRGGITFAQSSAKVIKIALFLRGPKEVIITAKVLYYLFFCTISAHLFRFFQSVLIGDYSISAPCFSGGLFRTSLFKTALFYCDRYFLLLPRFVHFALPSAPVYSLLAPVVAI